MKTEDWETLKILNVKTEEWRFGFLTVWSTEQGLPLLYFIAGTASLAESDLENGFHVSHTAIRKDEALSNREKQFLVSVERGDMATARLYLEMAEVGKGLDIKRFYIVPQIIILQFVLSMGNG